MTILKKVKISEFTDNEEPLKEVMGALLVLYEASTPAIFIRVMDLIADEDRPIATTNVTIESLKAMVVYFKYIKDGVFAKPIPSIVMSDRGSFRIEYKASDNFMGVEFIGINNYRIVWIHKNPNDKTTDYKDFYVDNIGDIVFTLDDIRFTNYFGG